MRVGFVGLGVMGRPMALNLMEAGHKVVAHNRSSSVVDVLVAAGAEKAETPAEAAAEADAVITCLPGPDEVSDVVLGADGILEGAVPGVVLIDMSTVPPSLSRRISAEAAERGLTALDAPVSGGEAGAIHGRLSIMVGGDLEALEQVRPLLECLGETVVHVGPAGSGQTVKAANQILVAGIIELVSEALVLLGASGVDISAAIDVLAGGLAGNRILDMKARGMIAGEFEPGFRVDLHHKDLGIALDIARDQNIPVPVTAIVAQLLVALRASGRGSLDHSALLLVVEELAGRTPPGV
jgi:2-hydroxy-3-oxopropionate reductase